MRSLVGFFVMIVALSACGADAGGDTDPTPPESTADQVIGRFPDVLDATAARADDDTWTISATLSSPYDSPDRYADAWRVLGPDGEVLGVRELLHDHAAEQPFTRSFAGVRIDAGVDVVTIEGRDLANGWGGATFELHLDDAG